MGAFRKSGILLWFASEPIPKKNQLNHLDSYGLFRLENKLVQVLHISRIWFNLALILRTKFLFINYSKYIQRTWFVWVFGTTLQSWRRSTVASKREHRLLARFRSQSTGAGGDFHRLTERVVWEKVRWERASTSRSEREHRRRWSSSPSERAVRVVWWFECLDLKLLYIFFSKIKK